MIEKHISVCCDGCGCAIDHYQNCSIKRAVEMAIHDGVIVKGKKHFCDSECVKKAEPKEAQKPSEEER